MPTYHIKIAVRDENVDEFINTLKPLWFDFLRVDGCSNYTVYQEMGNERSFFLIGKYESRKCLKDHLRSNHFQVLVGAAAVLGKSFKIALTEKTEKGGIDFARAQYSSLTQEELKCIE